jgi:hypothetical protein
VSVRTYLISLPERLLRSVVGLGAGAVRETATVALPDGVRKSQLYQNLVEATLRFLTEQVGGGTVVDVTRRLPEDFLTRRAAGNAIELLGIVAFRVSPVWVLAALADVCGVGRQLIPEIADALKAEGLLDSETQFQSVDQLLDGLERTSSRIASTINTPPLDVKTLRREWEALRDDSRQLRPTDLPSTESIRHLWLQLKDASAREGKSIFAMSSLMAVSAARTLPDRVRWLSASTKAGAVRTGQVFAGALLQHYRDTIAELKQDGYFTYASRHMRPYVTASIGLFSPKRRTATEWVIERFARRSPLLPVRRTRR